MRPRGCSLLPRALDPPRRAGALGCRRAPRRLCLVALATPRPACSSPRPNLALGASGAPLRCSLRPNRPPQPAVGATPAWMLHQAQLLLAGALSRLPAPCLSARSLRQPAPPVFGSNQSITSPPRSDLFSCCGRRFVGAGVGQGLNVRGLAIACAFACNL